MRSQVDVYRLYAEWAGAGPLLAYFVEVWRGKQHRKRERGDSGWIICACLYPPSIVDFLPRIAELPSGLMAVQSRTPEFSD